MYTARTVSLADANERIADNDGGGQYGWTPAVHTLTTHPSRGAHDDDNDAPVPPPPREVGRSALRDLRDQERARAMCLAARAIACAPRRVAQRPMGWGWVGARAVVPSEKRGPQKESMCASS